MSGLKPILSAVLSGLALTALASSALAQDGRYDEPYYDDRYDEPYYDDRYDYPDEDEYGHALAGRHISRDYLTGDYYDYAGTPVKDPRVGEQEGWRDGVVRTPPRWYWRRCGCSRLWYGGRWYDRPKLYDYGAYDYEYRHRLDRRTSYEYRWPRRNW